MSNGDLDKPEVWGEVRFDAASLEGVVAPQLGALQDAAGDVKAAEVRLAEAVQEEQKRITKAEKARGDKQEDVARRVEELALVGREISIERGVALKGAYMDIEPDDLMAFAGRITAFEVGTLDGKPLGRPDAIVLHVRAEDAVTESFEEHAFIAGDAEFTIQPIEQPDNPDA